MLKILLVSDHPLLREGLARLLREADSVGSVSEAASGEEALEQIRVAHPEVVLIHVSHPAGRRVRLLHVLREKAPDIPVVVLLDAVDDEVMMVALQAGARGCLDKSVDADHLIAALQDAASGEIALSERFANQIARMIARDGREAARQPYPKVLTRRELEVLDLLSHGLTKSEIARSLSVSESTIRAHLRTATQKLGVRNRVQAVARAHELGMVPTLQSSEDTIPPHEESQRLAGP